MKRNWWVKMFLEQIGGEIRHEQYRQNNHGASFIVELAIDKSSPHSEEIN